MQTLRLPSLATSRLSMRHWMSGTSPTPPPLWVQVAWIVAFSVLTASGFTILGFVSHADTIAKWLDLRRWVVEFARNLAVSLSVGAVILLLFRIAFALLGRGRIVLLHGWRRSVFFAAVPMLGTAIGWPIGMALAFGDLSRFQGLSSGNVVAIVVLTVLISLGFHTWFSLRTRQIRAEMRANEAQLRLLQGQMEPHFLFNTLATVISLVDADPPRAKHMLEALTDYLRASLGSLRHDDSTVGAELDLAARYLQLMRSRMGERLRFELDADASTRGAALAPLLLQPLIENAVKHGLEPQVDGGTVRVSVRRVREDGRELLRICVDDDGAGLAAAASRTRRQSTRPAARTATASRCTICASGWRCASATPPASCSPSCPLRAGRAAA
jgi:signal transduction histidine kinase